MAEVIFNTNLEKIFQGTLRAIGETADALKTEVEQAQVIPKDKGTLEASMTVDKSQIENGKVKIVVSTPYARRLYFHPEYRFRKTDNPNAKGKWFEDWLPNGSKETFAEDTFVSFYKKYAGV